MRISEESKELATLKYVEQIPEIVSRRYIRIDQHKKNKLRRKALRDVLDSEYLGLVSELAELWAEVHLGAFINEGTLPDESDLNEMKEEIEQIVIAQKPKEHTFQPFAEGLVNGLPMQIYTLLKLKIRRMELEEKLQKPTPAAQPSSQINIHGDNYGPVQQGGARNIQSSNGSIDEDK